MMAPDPIAENPQANAFLTRVAETCARQRVGNNQLDYLINESPDDTYFIDLTTKLYFGEVSRTQYTSDINGFYPTGTDQGALDCIFSQLGE